MSVVTGCMAVTAGGNSGHSGNAWLGEPETPERFVTLVALMCCLPQIIMTGGGLHSLSSQLSLGCFGHACPYPPV